MRRRADKRSAAVAFVRRLQALLLLTLVCTGDAGFTALRQHFLEPRADLVGHGAASGTSHRAGDQGNLQKPSRLSASNILQTAAAAPDPGFGGQSMDVRSTDDGAPHRFSMSNLMSMSAGRSETAGASGDQFVVVSTLGVIFTVVLLLNVSALLASFEMVGFGDYDAVKPCHQIGACIL